MADTALLEIGVVAARPWMESYTSQELLGLGSGMARKFVGRLGMVIVVALSRGFSP